MVDSILEVESSIKNEIEERILNKKDYAKQETLFHCSIAQATHNEFMSRLEPVLQEAIKKGVILYEYEHISNKDIISDNKMIMEFMNARNAEGAKSAMRIHILRAINQLKLEK
jgi:DNA-binding FadR family transcriptional regulator